MNENFVNIEFKDNIPSEIILEFSNDSNLRPSMQTLNSSWDNFTGLEPDVIIFIQNVSEALFCCALYDTLKHSLPRLWKKVKGTKSIAEKDSITINIILKDERNRSVQMVLDGKISDESIEDVIDKGFQLIDKSREQLFSTPEFVDTNDSGEQSIRLFYNRTTEKLEPFDFAKHKKFWKDVEDDINEMKA